jgi:hypothetical protein
MRYAVGERGLGVRAVFCFRCGADADAFTHSDTTVAVESDEEKQRRQEREDGMDQAWDYLLSRVLDGMHEPERRRWLREQEQQEEFEERDNLARRLASGSDTCLLNDYENETLAYIDC